MQADTLVQTHPTLTESAQTEPSLVRFADTGLPVVAHGREASPAQRWVIRFALTAVLGAIGGLAAAVVLNPTPLVLSSPTLKIAEEPRPAETNVATVAANATTTVVVPVAPNLAGKPARQSNEEMDRLKTRNKRLEALVKVLRKREAPTSARN